jgi:8-oxo-dGTP pyrophosphatase MutT (NUDIX family)
MALDLEEIDRSMSFHPSEATTISCGSVTIDPARQKVLLIWNKKLKIFQLPKGRKNIGEDMLSAAMRETYEETGVKATPLRLKIATRATPPSEQLHESDRKNAKAREVNGNGYVTAAKPSATCGCEITEGRLSTEFLGCCRYPDPQSSIPAIKVVFYFAGTADSTVPVGPGAPEEWEKLDTVWASTTEAARMLRFKAEAKIVKKALEDARKSGYPIVG